MLSPGSFQYICAQPQDIPKAVLPFVRSEISKHVGASMATMFPALAGALPRTVAAFEKNWGSPVLACENPYGEWLLSLVCERSDGNVFFPLRIIESPIEGSEFDEERAMLPLRWRELYRYFNSFAITTRSTRPNVWRNTPLPVAARMAFEEYAEEISAGASLQREFAKNFETDQLHCWLWSDAGDALLVDEARADRKVWHVRANDLRDVALLADPENVLDDYLAHLLSGGSSAGFNFRKAA